MKALCLSFLLSLWSLSQAATRTPTDYSDYLELKRETLRYNLENIETLNFVPRDVFWSPKKGALIVPRPNPLKRLYRPEHPFSDQWGMIYVPNIDAEKETKRLEEVESKISSPSAT